jgi:hypothetical protein
MCSLFTERTACGDFFISVRTFEGKTEIRNQHIVGHIVTFHKWYYVKLADCVPIQVARKIKLRASKSRKSQSQYHIFCKIFAFHIALNKIKSISAMFTQNTSPCSKQLRRFLTYVKAMRLVAQQYRYSTCLCCWLCCYEALSKYKD